MIARRFDPAPVPDHLPVAAERYARAGLPVVPLCWPTVDGRCAVGHEGCRGGKVPLLAGWRDLRLTPGGVRLAWRRHPLANIGLLLHAHNLLLLDLDGSAAIAEAVGLGLPEGPTDQCDRADGETGLHVLYRRGSLPMRSAVHLGTSGRIDVKAEGLAVLPPSRRFVDGRIVARSWWPGAGILDLRPGPAPGWVADLLVGGGGRTLDTLPGGFGKPPQAAAPPCVTTPLPPTVHALLDLGPTAFADGRYPSRSEAAFAVVTAMVRCGWPDDAITTTCLDAQWVRGMTDKHGDIPRYLDREIQSARRAVAAEDGGW